jgi:predicted metal-dependent peptidase
MVVSIQALSAVLSSHARSKALTDMENKEKEEAIRLEWDNATQEKAMVAYIFTRRQLIMKSPFYAALSMRLQPKIATPIQVLSGCWCAATNGKNFIINPDGWINLEPHQKIFVMKHEILHCVLRHPTRIFKRNISIWNISCDYVVNMILAKTKEDLPIEGSYWDNRFQRMDADTIYQILKKELDQKIKKRQGDQGDEDVYHQDIGEGQGVDEQKSKSLSQQQRNKSKDQVEEQQSIGRRKEPGKQEWCKRGRQRDVQEFKDLSKRFGAKPHSMMLDPLVDSETGESLSHENAENSKIQIENAWKSAFSQVSQLAYGKGDYPFGLDQIVERENTPRLPWERLLQQWFQARIREGYDWMRPNRRFIADNIYLPGRGKPSLGDVVVLLDTSGSVSNQLLSAFLGEIEGVLKASPARVFLVACDAAPSLIGEYENAHDFPIEVPIYSRGGTDFRPGVRWIEEHSGPFCKGKQHMGEMPRIAIYLTDGMGNYPTELPEGLDMLWVLSKNWERGSQWYPPVGEVIIAFEDLD